MLERPDLEAWASAAGDSLVKLAFVLTGDGHEAQDVVQTVLVRMVYSSTRPIENPQAYARRAVANEVASRSRRRGVFQLLTPKLVASFEATAPDAVDAVLDRQQLLQAMGRLSMRQRTVLTLRYFEDLDDQATGEILGCSAATVRSIAARALTKLRIQMSETER